MKRSYNTINSIGSIKTHTDKTVTSLIRTRPKASRNGSKNYYSLREDVLDLYELGYSKSTIGGRVNGTKQAIAKIVDEHHIKNGVNTLSMASIRKSL